MKKYNYTFYLFIIYLCLVIWILLFKMSSLNDFHHLDVHRTINLIPFWVHIETGINRSDIIKNFIIFVPLGIYMMMLNGKFFKAVLYSVAISVGIEILQFLFGIGITDINDVITNTAGAFAGIAFFSFLSLFFRRKEKLNHMFQIISSIFTFIFLVLIFVLFYFNR
ncbi:MAG: VanZ family protein [Erysipelotrichaceae bacterium]|nr:VanZ family protein [Erysipelotrichaceae bacterium]